MNTEKKNALRVQLQESLGQERFVKFVDDSNAGRVRWWQERAWDNFVLTHPEHDCSKEELSEALRICSLHYVPLQQDDVPLIHGFADWTEPYRAARLSKFRYAYSGPIYTQGAAISGTTKSVWFCSECRTAESAWLRKNGRTLIPLDWLIHRIDFEQLEAGELQFYKELGFLNDSHVSLGLSQSPHWLDKRNKFLSKLQPGDEVWTFKSPPHTWVNLCGRAGFAIVREGICVATLVVALN